MLKRITILLDETASSVAARQYAFHLARGMGAGLAGLAGVDLSRIEIMMPGTAGTTAYMISLEEQLKKQADDARARLHEAYERECQSAGVSFEWFSFDGDPIGPLILAAETCDLVITGHDTAFHGEVHEPASKMLAKLLLNTPRPMIVCADDANAAHGILIAYDGSIPAMRALQLFTLLGIGLGQRIQVTSIDTSRELAARRASGAVSYLRNHGFEVETCPIASGAHPADVLRIEVADRQSGTLVMGAYGHRGFREFLFGSTTSALVEDPPCSLFVYH